ncbi:hypothetical protein ACFQH9_12040 [Pseudonocardia lutea]|uniref:Mur ligase C-terminal domain-containing protein n=1 Tax=Pseudonocardia lutea TaxID=2172015 RepID=A0ABW1I7C5_9PSEU
MGLGRPQQVLHVGLGVGELPDLLLRLLGSYQADNAGVALAAVEGFLHVDGARLTAEQVHRGLGAVRAPGRLERVADDPVVVIDASHNPAGIGATVRGLRESLGVARLGVVLGVC